MHDKTSGPFQGFAYVSDTTFTVPLKGIINKVFGPNGWAAPGASQNTWAYNKANNAEQYKAYLEALHRHENLGIPGVKHSGHASSAQEAIDSTPADNVNKYLEDKIAPTVQRLLQTTESALTAAEADIRQRAADPLAGQGPFKVFRWKNTGESNQGTWFHYECVIGSEQEGCYELEPVQPSPGTQIRGGSQVQLDAGTFAPKEPVHLTCIRHR